PGDQRGPDPRRARDPRGAAHRPQLDRGHPGGRRTGPQRTDGGDARARRRRGRAGGRGPPLRRLLRGDGGRSPRRRSGSRRRGAGDAGGPRRDGHGRPRRGGGPRRDGARCARVRRRRALPRRLRRRGRSVMSGPALVIPIKATLGAKQRLSTRLGGEERRLLALAMAGDTLRVAGRAVARSRCVVVAGDAEVARLATRHDMAVVRERGAGQSAALRAGVAWALERGHTAVATIAADCAMLDIDDLLTLMEKAARRGRFLACAPDAEGKGTNAAAVRPLDVDVWRFGPNSLERHRAAAEAERLRFEVLDLPSLRIDCDRPEDLLGVISQPRPTATFHVLRQLGLAGRRAVG